jgi:predicted PurR-regulated permease PerM
MKKSEINTSSNATIYTYEALRIIGILIISVLLVLLLLFGFRVILLILAGILIATFFLGITDFIRSKTPLAQNYALALAVLLVIGVVVGLSFALAPHITDQVNTMSNELPKAANNTMSSIKDSEIGSVIVTRAEQMDLGANTSTVATFFGSLFSTLSTIYIVLFLGLFFMVAPNTYVDGFITLFPKSRRNRTREIVMTMGKTLKSWLLGKLLSMLIVGVLTGIGLTIMGVPLALTLAIFAAFISFIPNFGPILALIPAFLLAFTASPTTALYVVLLYVGIQAIESNVLTPLIQSKMISFPMAMILIAQIVLGIFTGILGVILAVPLVALLMVLVKMAYVEDVLGDTTIDVKHENSKEEE